MIPFLRAHGYDPGPTERPFLAGGLSGGLAVVPSSAAFVGFGSFGVLSEQVIEVSRLVTAALLFGAFTVAGIIYGAVFRRAANDRQAGWLLGLAYGFVLWIAAPIVAFPLTGARSMAAGVAATGFLVTFLAWGLFVGLLFPWLHRPLSAGVGQDGHRQQRRFGPDAAKLKQTLFRRPL